MRASISKATKKSSHPSAQTNGHTVAAPDAAHAMSAAMDSSRGRAVRGKAAETPSEVTNDSDFVPGAMPEKGKRPKKEKVVRDSFTMPKSDYEKLAKLKQKCLEAGVAVKKSELLRAGLLMLDAAPTKRLLEAVSQIETVRTGRPAKT